MCIRDSLVSASLALPAPATTAAALRAARPPKAARLLLRGAGKASEADPRRGKPSKPRPGEQADPHNDELRRTPADYELAKSKLLGWLAPRPSPSSYHQWVPPFPSMHQESLPWQVEWPGPTTVVRVFLYVFLFRLYYASSRGGLRQCHALSCPVNGRC